MMKRIALLINILIYINTLLNAEEITIDMV